MKDFKDKVAVITGAASGIGYGLAERAAKEGMNVVLADIEEETLAEAEKNIRKIGVDTLTVKTDVSKADDVKALAEKTMDAFGAVHLLCNNAGVGIFNNVLEYRLVDWQTQKFLRPPHDGRNQETRRHDEIAVKNSGLPFLNHLKTRT